MTSIEGLLKATLKAGGHELRLIPARRIVIVTGAGEREVQGPQQTSTSIDQLLMSLMTPEARRQLESDRVDWVLDVPEVGRVRAWAERRNDSTHAGFLMEGEAQVQAEAPPALAAQAGPGRPAAEIEELLTLLCELGGSDLHISAGVAPMMRVDGQIRPVPGRRVFTASDTERALWPLAPERNREEFTSRHDTDFAHEIPGLARFRCNYFLDRKGMGGVFRVIPSRIMSVEEMGLPKEILQLCHLPKGLILVTGPTGSGKSTTLCALIDYVNRIRSDHIITVEDPVEFVHENRKCLINQREVGEHTRSFKDALRAALREDPDIVLVGEMRDLETVAIAIETAETGHLVFATLHTSSATSTVDRIIDQFPAERQGQIRLMLAESLKGVICQVLCRKVGGGRVPALEVLIGIPSVSNLIREAKAFQIPSVMQTGKKYGMCLMNESLLDLVKRKTVAPEEAYAKAADKAGFLNMLKKNDIDTSWVSSEAAALS